MTIELFGLGPCFFLVSFCWSLLLRVNRFLKSEFGRKHVGTFSNHESIKAIKDMLIKHNKTVYPKKHCHQNHGHIL